MDKYKLTTEQEAIVEKLYALMAEAKSKGVGFFYDKTTFKMSAYNSTGIVYIDTEETEDNCNLNEENAKQCPEEFDIDFYSDGQYLVVKEEM